MSSITPLPTWLAHSIPVKLLSLLYRTIINKKNRTFDKRPDKSQKVDRPVISVGGIRAGGTGKTPLSLLLGNYLIEKGFSIGYLSRGYKRKSKENLFIAPHEETSWELIGDEPMMLHKKIPEAWIAIGADRVKSARLLSQKVPHKTIFILDDGFQHRRIVRDCDIVCLHENFFSDLIIPSGYLREPITSLGRAHIAVIITNEKKELFQEITFLQKKFPYLTIVTMFQSPLCWKNLGTGEERTKFQEESPIVLCGIARPERFLKMVRNLGISPKTEHIFPDHYRYSLHDLNKIQDIYSSSILTTEKDGIRLQKVKVEILTNIWYLKISLCFTTTEMEKYFYSVIDKLALSIYS